MKKYSLEQNVAKCAEHGLAVKIVTLPNGKLAVRVSQNNTIIQFRKLYDDIVKASLKVETIYKIYARNLRKQEKLNSKKS